MAETNWLAVIVLDIIGVGVLKAVKHALKAIGAGKKSGGSGGAVFAEGKHTEKSGVRK